MKLTDILTSRKGTYVWLFTRDTPVKTIQEAHRRLQAYLMSEKHSSLKVTARGQIMTDAKNYVSEPVLVIEIA